MRTIQSEFPDYDDVELLIPPFTCEPWHNDMCPRYVFRGTQDSEAGCELILWTQYKNPEWRELGCARYCFQVGTEDENMCGEFRESVEFESLDDLRAWADDWYFEHVGYRPDTDWFEGHGEEMPLGQLLHLVGTSLYMRAEK